MRTTIDRHAAVIDDTRLDRADLRSVLAAVLAIHALEDPRRFPDVLLQECEQLLPADHIDGGELRAAWADRSASDHRRTSLLSPARSSWAREPRTSVGGHRLDLLATASRRVFAIVLERYAEPFGPRCLAIADALQPHLGPAFDHARLRAAEWGVGDAMRGLTVREQEVLALVADGRTNRDIGMALFIEPRTVEKHVEHIRTKLGARSRADAAAKWARGVAVPIG
ncbi:helix-turn-helix transcriptional regulator [Amnibacterium sp.]|uniref:helix-turn-helix transcriptional regulator n=1 Tax=Amnibacterium sp. TaxID=1872496 RepID=UPI0026053C78|nr:helix-turn-helix transcriptional regulator [Amnibacterium sp.]MCU1472794.1 HTH-type transcriptional regulator malT [Amnibacterium sp.]